MYKKYDIPIACSYTVSIAVIDNVIKRVMASSAVDLKIIVGSYLALYRYICFDSRLNQALILYKRQSMHSWPDRFCSFPFMTLFNEKRK